jgi:hypothetical protein
MKESQAPEAVVGSLAGDLSDIYRDLKNGGLSEEAQTQSPNDVLCYWRFPFESHWSRHALSALNAINSLLFTQHVDHESNESSVPSSGPPSMSTEVKNHNRTENHRQ